MTTLTLTQSRDGGYRFHKDTCKKIEGRPTYTVDEVAEDSLDALEAATAASCCKPSAAQIAEVKDTFGIEPEDTDNGDDTPEAEAAEDEVDTEGDTPDDDDLLDDEVDEPEDDTEASDNDTEEAEMATDDEDLLGDTPVQTVKKPKATPGTPQRSQEGREMDVVLALADILGIQVADGVEFPGHGKAIKVKGGGSIYLNSKHFADVRAKDLETARGWVGDGLGTARGGNYVRVSVEGL